jgi:hypothetical protein
VLSSALLDLVPRAGGFTTVANQAKDVSGDSEPAPAPGRRGAEARYCQVCGVKISSYNPGPNCWQHTIGHPWRGPTAKPKF